MLDGKRRQWSARSASFTASLCLNSNSDKLFWLKLCNLLKPQSWWKNRFSLCRGNGDANFNTDTNISISKKPQRRHCCHVPATFPQVDTLPLQKPQNYELEAKQHRSAAIQTFWPLTFLIGNVITSSFYPVMTSVGKVVIISVWSHVDLWPPKSINSSLSPRLLKHRIHSYFARNDSLNSIFYQV